MERTLKTMHRLAGLPLTVVIGMTALAPVASRAQYNSYNVNVNAHGADCIRQAYRSPNVPPDIYDAIHQDDVTSSDGGTGYFYGGFTHQNIVNGTPSTLVQYVCWPATGWFAPYVQQIPYFAGTNEVGYPQVGEGSSCAIKGYWPQFTTNLWTQEVTRYWQNGTAHVGYQGHWIKEPVSGNWYHVATFMYPFSVIGVDGMSGWQEDFGSYTGVYTVDHAGGYYHTNGVWVSANQIQYTGNSLTDGGIATLIDTNTATESESGDDNALTNSYNYNGNMSLTLTMTNQPAQPAFDPIVVTSYSASVISTQLLVQWQLPLTSSPQLSYVIQVFDNSSYTGAPAITYAANDPETREAWLNISGISTPYVSLTIADIFFNTNPPILITPVTPTLSPAANPSGTVGGLAFQYYEASSGNWGSLPNFSSLTPVYQGAVSFTDPTPRRKRINYGFNYTGYITVPADGVYAFTLHSGDGSELIIDGTTVIDFDGLHDSSQFKSGGIALAAGAHTFNVQYFKGAANPVNTTAYTDGLGLAWQGPGIPYEDVPSSAYSRIPGASEPTVTLGTLVGGSTICSSNLALSATVTANGNTINKVVYYLTDYQSYYFRPSQGVDYFLGSSSVSPYTLNAPIYAAATNAVRARVFYNSTNILDSAVVFFAATNMQTATPTAPWQLVGNAPQNYPVGGSIQGGTYTLVGDNLSLMALDMKGNCTIVAHLASLPGDTGGSPDLTPDADGTWLAGIIMRSTTNTTPGTPLADGTTTRETSVFAEDSGGTYFANDLQLGGNGAPNNYSASVGSQTWFKIQRVGNQFTNSVSSDGTTWTMVNSTNLATVGSDCYACLFLYQDPSPNPNLNVATFNNVTITGDVVAPATVTISPPATNAYAGSTVTLTANAGGTQPYSYQWQYNGVNVSGATNAALSLINAQPAVSGDYTVVMTDGDGNTASATALVSVLFSSDPSQPQVALTSPTNDEVFVAPATINLSASVTNNGYTISSVQFYNGATLVATATSAPYTATWTNVPAGTYTLLAWVNYSGGDSSNSSPPVIVSVDPLPATPQNLTVISPATNLISISWAAAANATGYILTRNGVTYATLSGTAYQDFGVANGTSYCYSVEATNSLGDSGFSSTNCSSAAITGNALYWDAGSSPTGPQDGSDYWGYSAATWWNGSTNVDWTDDSVAVIGLAATTNCTITLTNSVTPGGIVFGADSGGSYTVGNLTGVETINMPVGAAINTYGTATITAPVTAAGTFLAGGDSTLTLSGSGLTCPNALVSSGTLQVLKVTADCPYIVTNTGTLEIGYTTGGGYANTAMQIYGAGAGATTGLYLAGGIQYNSQGEIQLLGAPTTLRQYGTGYAEISIFDINQVGLYCTAAASGSATDPNIEMINEGYGMTVEVDPGANTATGDFTINGPLNVGNYGFYKEGNGSLLLNGVAGAANLGLQIKGGTVICGITNCLGANADVNLSSGATLNLNGFSQAVGWTNSNNGLITSLPAGSTVNFGGACTLTVTNSILIAGALQMNLVKGGTPNCSQLATPGRPMTFGGSLAVTSLGTNAFAAGDTFQLFSASSYAGSFSSLSLPALPAGLGWITNLSINGSIQVASGVPLVTVSPSVATNYVGGTVTFKATASGGTPPYSYQWQFNGVNIAGATSSNLTLVDLQLASSGLYTVVVPGVGGSGTATAQLEVLTVPSGYAVQALAYGPLAYWRLNEPAGSTTAYDLMGNYNGTISGTGVAMGTPGLGNAVSAPGFETTNLCATFTNNNSPSISIPAMTALNTNALTVTGWIYRNTNEISSSALFCENSGTTIRSGLKFGAGNVLAFTWNSTTLESSTLIPLTNQWTFVAWVMTPTNGKIYMGTNLLTPVMQVYTNSATEAVQNFGTSTPYLGYNAAATADRFGGLMDEVAVYNYAMTYQQITNLWLSSLVAPNPPSVTLTNPASGSTYLTATTTNLSLGASVTANGHTITAVKFYAGTNLLGSVASAPYTYIWAAAPGNYSVYAQAVYENGAMNSSLPVLITINPLPTAPASVTASALGTNLIVVQWPPGGYATSYIVSRGDLGPVAVVPATTTNYLDFNVVANGSYCYSVVSSNSFGVSVASPSGCATVPAAGTALVWDAAVSGVHPQDGSGTWGSSSSTWWNGTADVVWSDGCVAVFGTGPGGGGTVTLANNVTPGQIIFNTGSGYIITGSSVIYTPVGAPITVQAEGDASGTINNNLQGSTGLYLTGSGTLTLGAQSAYLNGPVTVNGGTLALNDGDTLLYTSSLTVQSGGTVLNEVNNTLRSMGEVITIQAGGTLTTANGVTLNVDNYGTNVVLQGGSLVSSGTPNSSYGSFNFGEANALITVAGGNPAAAVISASGISIGGAAGSVPFTFNVSVVAAGTGPDLVVSGNIGNPATTAFGLLKNGPGTMALTATNDTYTGTTTISNGTLEVDGTIPAGACTVATNGTLSGVGLVLGVTTNQPGGTLAPGDYGNTIGKLTISNYVTLAGQTVIGLSVAAGGAITNDSIYGNTNTFGGSLVVTNIGTNPLVLGDTFKLFLSKTNLGSFASMTLPSLSPGLSWTNTLTANGTIWVTNSAVTLAYTAGPNGTLSGPTSQTVTYGASGTAVTAVPNANYHFVNWSDGSTANPRTDTGVTTNVSVTASFAINTFTLAYAAGPNGTISGTTPQTVIYGGSGTAVTAVPNSGCHFVNWSDGSTVNPRTDTDVTSNLTVTAGFVISPPPVIAPGTIALSAGSFTLGGTGVVGQTYILLTASNLVSPIWMPIATNMADTNGMFQFTDPDATNVLQFYRIGSP